MKKKNNKTDELEKQIEALSLTYKFQCECEYQYSELKQETLNKIMKLLKENNLDRFSNDILEISTEMILTHKRFYEGENDSIIKAVKEQM